MQTIQPIEMEDARGFSNLVRTMAQSPRTLEGYLQFRRALNESKLSPKVRELIASNVRSMANGELANEVRQLDRKTAAALKFARDLVTRSAECSTEDLRDAGYGEAEIVDIVAEAGLNVFEIYFNIVVQPPIALANHN